MPERGDLLDRRWTLALLVVAMAIPLLWPQIPPLVDLLGHMGRYQIQTHIDRVPALAEAFSFKWRLLGNLGADLLIEPLAALFGVELGAKLIVLAIPPLTAAGMLWLAREVHGRVPQAALFALPLAYAYPFQFGFLNFSLSVAFALLALALWVRLGRIGRVGLRAGIFAPIACLLWLTHMVGWGLFGLAAFGTELVRRRRSGDPLVPSAIRAGITCLPLALPLIPTVLLRSTSPEAATFDWFNWEAKLFWLLSLLRERWYSFDVASIWPMIGLVAIALTGRRLRFDPLLSVPAALCLVAFIVMPRVTFGSAYADMRLLPFTFAMALLAIRPVEGKWGKWLAVAGLLFTATRLTATTVSFAWFDRSYRSELNALDHVREGTSVLSLVARPCGNEWTTERLDHLPAIAIVRRNAFTNDQWTSETAQLIEIRKQGVEPFSRDPSQLVYPKQCREPYETDLHRAVATFNRAAFDYVWTINVRPGAVQQPDLRLIWTNGHSALYRVEKTATIETPAGSGMRPTT